MPINRIHTKPTSKWRKIENHLFNLKQVKVTWGLRNDSVRIYLSFSVQTQIAPNSNSMKFSSYKEYFLLSKHSPPISSSRSARWLCPNRDLNQLFSSRFIGIRESWEIVTITPALIASSSSIKTNYTIKLDIFHLTLSTIGRYFGCYLSIILQNHHHQFLVTSASHLSQTEIEFWGSISWFRDVSLNKIHF